VMKSWTWDGCRNIRDLSPLAARGCPKPRRGNRTQPGGVSPRSVSRSATQNVFVDNPPSLLFSFPVFPAQKGRQGHWRRCPLRRTQRRYRLPGVAPCGASIQSTGEKVGDRAGNLGLTPPGYGLPPHSRLPRAGVLARRSAANRAQQNQPVPGSRGRAGKAKSSSRQSAAPAEPPRRKACRELS
jgi:hypothetical protein